MKLDDVLRLDALRIDPNEWSCLMELGPLKGSLPARLINGYPYPAGPAHPNGGIFLSFEYIAPSAHTYIGYRITRVWRADGVDYIRTVRSDTWAPAWLATPGEMVAIQVIIEPKDWA